MQNEFTFVDDEHLAHPSLVVQTVFSCYQCYTPFPRIGEVQREMVQRIQRDKALVLLQFTPERINIYSEHMRNA